MTTLKIQKKPTSIELTERAIAKVKELIANENSEEELYLRVAVKPGGCSGFSYDMFFDTEIENGDVVREFDGFKVLVDKESLDLIKGSTLDYEDGLNKSGFHISNPNATRSCGCGSSFS